MATVQNSTIPGASLDPDDYWQHNVHEILFIYLSPILLIVGTIGNALSVIILRHRLFRYSSTGFILTALASVDIAVLNTGLLRIWVTYAFLVNIRNLSSFACKFHNVLTYYTRQLASWTLIILTIERTVSVCNPLRCRQLFSKRRTVIVWLAIAAVLFGANCSFFFSSFDLLPDTKNQTDLKIIDEIERQVSSTGNLTNNSTSYPNIRNFVSTSDFGPILENPPYRNFFKVYYSENSMPNNNSDITNTRNRTYLDNAETALTDSANLVILERSENVRYVCKVRDERSTFFLVYWSWIDAFVGDFIPLFVVFTGNVITVTRIVNSRRTRVRQLATNSRKPDKMASTTAMLIGISAMFLVLSLPIDIYFIYYAHNGMVRPSVEQEAVYDFGYAVVTLLYYANNAFDFLMYILRGTKFRRALLETLIPCHGAANTTCRTALQTREESGRGSRTVSSMNGLSPTNAISNSYRTNVV